MQISEREIRESLRLLLEPPLGDGSKPQVDEETTRLVIGCLARVPEMRMDMVTSLRLAVEENRYRVPEDRVAEMMLGRLAADRLY